ncbi:C2H2 finger domain transcription factor [Botrytis cinerea]
MSSLANSSSSSRTSSISSTSSSKSLSDSTNAGIGKKKFCCSFAGCGKSFSRSEHLHRHALNHKDGNHTCLRCRAHFRRRDLLDRHMNRHKEKDDEAGGEGLGVLATRKRLWRDADGNIVATRRPSYVQEGTKRRQTTTRADRKMKVSIQSDSQDQVGSHQLLSPPMNTPTIRSRSPSTIVVDSGRSYPEAEGHQRFESHHPVPWNGMTASIPSPPTSESSIHSAGQSPAPELGDLDGLYEETTWPAIPNGLPQAPLNRQLPEPTEYNMGPSHHWGSQPFQTFMGQCRRFPGATMISSSQIQELREEKPGYEAQEEPKREWGYSYSAQGGNFHRTYGVGRC